jgi:hypothetical protein
LLLHVLARLPDKTMRISSLSRRGIAASPALAKIEGNVQNAARPLETNFSAAELE